VALVAQQQAAVLMRGGLGRRGKPVAVTEIDLLLDASALVSTSL
jgi:hypothetical protein